MSNTATTTKWAVDPAHTEVLFKVKHLVITTVTGKFKEFTGEVLTENEDFEGAAINFSIDIASVDTGSTDRDNHLRSADFFDAENHPSMTFSGKLAKNSDGYQLVGDLTIRGTSNPIILEVDYNGTVTDPWGNKKAGFELTGKLNRKDYGLTWNTITEAGSMLVGEEVKLAMSVQLSVA